MKWWVIGACSVQLSGCVDPQVVWESPGADAAEKLPASTECEEAQSLSAGVGEAQAALQVAVVDIGMILEGLTELHALLLRASNDALSEEGRALVSGRYAGVLASVDAVAGGNPYTSGALTELEVALDTGGEVAPLTVSLTDLRSSSLGMDPAATADTESARDEGDEVETALQIARRARGRYLAAIDALSLHAERLDLLLSECGEGCAQLEASCILDLPVSDGSEARAWEALRQNMSDASALNQAALNAMTLIHQRLDITRALVEGATASGLSSAQREELEESALALLNEIDLIAEDTVFQGLPLAVGEEELVIAFGTCHSDPCVIEITLWDLRSESLGLSPEILDLSSLPAANDTLSAVDYALEILGAGEERGRQQARRLATLGAHIDSLLEVE